ncbi:hypothetical protein ABEB36_007229 [Hypothenemus hampei]|uniref:Uncharacterized protein n=1 Tax=Hypothenemus hampei TaxID=57062 RepID=A0ABD1EU52_HYPHA
MSLLTFMEAYVRCKHDGLTLAMERTPEETDELYSVIASNNNLSADVFFLGGFKFEKSPFISVE